MIRTDVTQVMDVVYYALYPGFAAGTHTRFFAGRRIHINLIEKVQLNLRWMRQQYTIQRQPLLLLGFRISFLHRRHLTNSRCRHTPERPLLIKPPSVKAPITHLLIKGARVHTANLRPIGKLGDVVHGLCHDPHHHVGLLVFAVDPHQELVGVFG